MALPFLFQAPFVDLAWLPGRGLHPVKTDPVQVRQILANLCVNASDAITGIGKIEVLGYRVLVVGTPDRGDPPDLGRHVKEGHKMKRFLILIIFLTAVYGGIAPAGAREVTSPTAANKIVVGITDDPPCTYKNAQGQWTGLSVELWQQVARDLKLDYTYKELSLQEVLTALRQGTIDFTIDALYVTAEREEQFDYSIPFGKSRLAIAIRPDAGDHPWLVAVKIFFSWGTLKVIAVLAVILFCLGFLFWLIEHKGNPEPFGQGTLRGIGAGIYWVGSTLASGVCFGISLKSVSGRILGLIWMLICALALSAFIASLTSSLFSMRQAEQVYTAEKLRSMHLGTEALEPSAKLLESMGGRATYFVDNDDGLDALLAKKIDGYVYDEVTLHYYAENKYRDRIVLRPTALKGLTIAFAMPKNSPLRKPVNVALLKIMEEPMWESLLSRYGLNVNFMGNPILSSGFKRRGARLSE